MGLGARLNVGYDIVVLVVLGVGLSLLPHTAARAGVVLVIGAWNYPFVRPAPPASYLHYA